jgi:tetratricopeptide (TPR) repeat protein
MSGFLRYFFAATLVALTASAGAQSSPHGSLPPAGHTVSVASLLVPEKAWEHLNKAIEADRAHRGQEAEQEIAKALEISPRFPQAYLLRGARKLDARHFQQAVDDFLLARHIDPRVMWSSTLLAGAENSLGHYHDAAVTLDLVYGPETDSWQFVFEKARSMVGLGDAQGALRWTASAIRTAPSNNLDVLLLRADALNLAHRTPEAIGELETYLASPLPQDHRDSARAMLTSFQQEASKTSEAMLATR